MAGGVPEESATATTAAQVANDNPAFFDLLRAHCIEGCFCDPRWGGNRDGIMWRWFDYLYRSERRPG